jgi:hypothetical protein
VPFVMAPKAQSPVRRLGPDVQLKKLSGSDGKARDQLNAKCAKSSFGVGIGIYMTPVLALHCALCVALAPRGEGEGRRRRRVESANALPIILRFVDMAICSVYLPDIRRLHFPPSFPAAPLGHKAPSSTPVLLLLLLAGCSSIDTLYLLAVPRPHHLEYGARATPAGCGMQLQLQRVPRATHAPTRHDVSTKKR